MADGSLKFDTKIDTSGFEKGTNTLKDMMNRAVQSIRTAGNQAAGAFTGAETGIKALVAEIDRYRDGLYYLEKEGFYFGDKEYDEAYSRLVRLEAELNQYKKSLVGADGQQKKSANSAKKLGKEIDKTNQKTSKFGKTLRLLRMSLLFSFAFRALNASMKAIGEGFQNLAQYSTQTNKDISALKTSLQTLKNSLATAFAPVLTVIAPALQTLINYLSQAISTIGQFFAALLTGATTFTKAKDAQIDYAKSLAKAGKEADKALSPIDKLNNVSDSGAGGYEAPGPQQMFEEIEIDNKLIDKVEKFKELLEPVINAFDRLKIAVAPFAENVGTGLKWMYDNVLVPFAGWTISNLIPSFLDMLGVSIGVLNSVIEVFKPYGLWLWENFLQPVAQWAGDKIIDGLGLLTQGLQNLSNWILNNQDTFVTGAIIVGGFFAAFKITQLLTALAPLISTLSSMIASSTILSSVLSGISAILSAIASPIGIAVAAIGLLIYSFIDLYNNSESFRQSLVELSQTWMMALQPLVDFVNMVLASAWNDILKPIIEFFLNTLLPNLIDTFKNLWENVLVPLADFIGTILQPVFQVLSDLLTLLWQNVILPLAEAIGTVFKEAWDALYQILNKTIIPIVNKVITVFTKLWKNVINPVIDVLWKNLKPAFETVFSGIKTVIEGLKTTLSGIIKFIKGVFTGDWKTAWNGIKDIFKGIWDALVGIVKTPVNLIIDIINGLISGVVSGINTVIKALNALSFDVPDWVPVLGGKTFGFNLKTLTAPKIPRLATGTVVPANYGEFLAILGDNRREPEVVSPISAMKQAFKEAWLEMGGVGTGEIHIYLEGDAKGVFKLVRAAENENYRATGKAVFIH